MSDLSVLNQQPIKAWAWPKILLFVPLFPALPFADKVFWSFMSIAQQGPAFLKAEYGRTDYARNMAANTLLNSDFTHILMLDADHVHPPDIIQRLAAHIIKRPEIQIVGGLNFKRAAPYDPCCFVKIPGEDDSYGFPHEWDAGLIRVDLLGTGSILIAREVFETIDEPYFFYDYSKVDDGFYPSEDVAFSKKCDEAGIVMYVDTQTTSPHMMVAGVDEDTYRQYWTQHRLNQEERLVDLEAIDNGRS